MSIHYKTMATIAILCSTSLNAGTLSDSHRFSGLWMGVGGGYINTTTSGNTNINMISTGVSPAEYLLSNNQDNHFSPLVNIGYLFDQNNHWLLGLKGVYKYIGSEQFDQAWSGTFENGTYQTAGLHTKLNHEAFLLLDAGYQFDRWMVYGGVGLSMNTVSVELNGDMLPSTSINFIPVNITKNKTLWGGAGQVGFEYMLPNRFMIDISYNLVVSSQDALPTVVKSKFCCKFPFIQSIKFAC